MTRVRIAAVQYDPQFQDVKGNMQRVDKMIEYLTPELVDILLLPEMAFTGYMFANREEIDPFLELEDGPSTTWARQTAMRLQCAVLVGYPEFDRATGNAFNSIAIVDETGDLQVGWKGHSVSLSWTFGLIACPMQTVYRKHFLYDTDKTWATEGPCFRTLELRLKGISDAITIAPGICMDLVTFCSALPQVKNQTDFGSLAQCPLSESERFHRSFRSLRVCYTCQKFKSSTGVVLYELAGFRTSRRRHCLRSKESRRNK